MKSDVNEEDWPNAELAIHSSYAGALIDGLPADNVKAGDEREIQQMKELQLYSWVKETRQIDLAHGLARRLKRGEVRSRCALKDFATCAFMQANSSCEMFARPPKEQERDGWIWRLHGAMNGMRKASRDFHRIPGWCTHRAHGFQTWPTGAMCRTEQVLYLMWTTLSSVPSQRRSKNSGCRSRSWS